MENLKISSSGWQRSAKATADNETVEVLIFNKASVEKPSFDFIFSVVIVDANGTTKDPGDLVCTYDKTTGKVTIAEAGVPTVEIAEGDLFLISGTFVTEK